MKNYKKAYEGILYILKRERDNLKEIHQEETNPIDKDLCEFGLEMFQSLFESIAPVVAECEQVKLS